MPLDAGGIVVFPAGSQFAAFLMAIWLATL